MTGPQIEALLAALEPYQLGWQTEIPPADGTFFGHPLAIAFETWSTPGPGRPPRPSTPELELARGILGELAAVLGRAEETFAADRMWAKDGGPACLTNPHLWISRERLEEAADLWGLVVEWLVPDLEGQFPFYVLDFNGPRVRELWGDRGPYPPTRRTVRCI